MGGDVDVALDPDVRRLKQCHDLLVRKPTRDIRFENRLSAIVVDLGA
jgi:hypothetical protein